MKICFHKKKWNTGVAQVHVEPPTTLMIKSKHIGKWDKYFVKMKLHRDPVLEKSYLCEFKMALFNNGYLEEFLLFVRKFNMTLEAFGMLETVTKAQSLRMLVYGEA